MAGNGELAYTALVANVILLPIDSDLTQTLRMGSEHFRRRYGVAVAAGTAPILRGVVEQTLGMVPGVAREADRWGGYVAVDETSDLVVGSCAFKGPPTADGTVEIAYYTFGPYEGQGYAKATPRVCQGYGAGADLHCAIVASRAPRDRAHAARKEPLDLRRAKCGDAFR